MLKPSLNSVASTICPHASVQDFGEIVRFRQIIGALIAVAISVIGAPATAFAGPYPAEPPSSTVSAGAVQDGGTVIFSGRGFLPFERISIVISVAGSESSADFQQGSAGGFVPPRVRLSRPSTLIITADRAGAFSVRVRLTQIGTATLVATGLTSGVTVTEYVEVLPPPEGDDGGGDGDDDPARDDPALPTTGQSGALLLTAVVGGVAAVLLGGALLGFARRRRADTE